MGGWVSLSIHSRESGEGQNTLYLLLQPQQTLNHPWTSFENIQQNQFISSFNTPHFSPKLEITQQTFLSPVLGLSLLHQLSQSREMGWVMVVESRKASLHSLPPISPPLALHQLLLHCGLGVALFMGQPTTPECGKTEKHSCVSKSHSKGKGKRKQGSKDGILLETLLY